MILIKKFILLFFICLFAFLPFSTLYAESVELAPLNPEFISYQRNLENNSIDMATTSDGYSLGERPSPASHVFTENEYTAEGVDTVMYPPNYDLRTYGKVTAIRDQSNCGACWTFAAMASAESFGLPSNPWDFSEQDMNAHHGFDPIECAGGNDDMATAYASRWDGLVKEPYRPYPYPVNQITNQASCYSASKYVQEVIKIPARTSFTDNDKIKNFIMTNGAVYVSFYYDVSFISSNDENFYNYVNADTNHAVAVIGWNDNYSSTNFKPGTQPAGNGAFLVRNSWGTSRHGDGYFWISYYDTSFIPRVSYSDVEAKGHYTNLYQYDTLGYVNKVGSTGATTMWAANIFTADSDEKISAVSFHITDINVAYRIEVYTDVTAGLPTSGFVASIATGTKEYAGYYTIDLTTPVYMNEGTNFSIVVKLTHASAGVRQLAVEYIVSGYSSSALSNLKESFYSSNGTSWHDYYTDPSFSTLKVNNCIKAFSKRDYNYYIPVFKHQPDYWGGLGVTNLSSTDSASVDVAIYNQSGTLLGTEATRTIPAKGQDAFTIGLVLNSHGWVKVTSTERLAGLSFYGQDDTVVAAKMYMADVPFVETLSKLMVVPHVADNVNWDTVLYIANPNTATAGVALTYTNKAGTASAPYNVFIPANGSKEIAMDIIAGSTDVRGGYVTISSLKGLAAFALYHNLKTNSYSFAGINAVDISE